MMRLIRIENLRRQEVNKPKRRGIFIYLFIVVDGIWGWRMQLLPNEEIHCQLQRICLNSCIVMEPKWQSITYCSRY